MKPNRFLFPAVLFSLILGQVSSDLYLSSLTIISKDLHTTINIVQFSISSFMLGYCFSQPIYGPLSDAIGRKKPLIAGLLLCLTGSVICSFSNSIEMLLFGRFLQGLGGGAGPALAITIIRDLAEGRKLAKINSFFVAVNVFAISCSPLIGSYILFFFNWRANFIFLSMLGFLVLVCIIFILPETNQHKTFQNLYLSVIAANLKRLFKSKLFIGYTICRFSLFASIIAWLTACPVILHSIGFTAVWVGGMTAVAGFAYVIGSLINAKFVTKYGIIKMIQTGVLITMCASIFLLFVGLIYVTNLLLIMFSIVLFMFGGSFIGPNAYIGGISPFPKIAGLAVAFMGGDTNIRRFSFQYNHFLLAK